MAKVNIPTYIDIIETDKQLEKLMLIEVVKELNKRIPKRIDEISSKLRDDTFEFLKGNSTYRSLVGGDLAGHFGIPTAGRVARIDTIIRAVADGMKIRYVPVKLKGKKFTGGIEIGILRTNLAEVLFLAEGLVMTEKGVVLDWLNWLLTLGDTVIITKYDVELGTGLGRSGLAVMVPEDAGSWRVPPKYSGTIQKNWLTRAFNDNISAYLSIIENTVKQELQRI